MRTSEQTDQLDAALAVAQGQMTAAKKSKTNPAFKSRYSDLDDIWDAIRVPLSANGLSVSQLLDTTEAGRLCLVTRLAHSSGQWLVGTMLVPEQATQPGRSVVQAMGSDITYCRRYALGAIAGITSDEDTDGNAASAAKPTQTQSAAVAQPTRQTSAPVQPAVALHAPPAGRNRSVAWKAMLAAPGFIPTDEDLPACAEFAGSILGRTVPDVKALTVADMDAVSAELQGREAGRKRWFAIAEKVDDQADRVRIGRCIGRNIASRREVTAAEWATAATNWEDPFHVCHDVPAQE